MDELSGRPTTARQAARLSTARIGVLASGVLFALLLAHGIAGWGPLLRADRAMLDGWNGLVAGNDLAVSLLRGASWFGGRDMLLVAMVSGAGYLLIRRQRRLAGYTVATIVGALILDPVVKLLVDRVRPVAENVVANAPGPSFPSGHALDSLVTYGTLLLIFLPAAPHRSRKPVLGLVAALLAAIGLSRVGLGVHYPTDVLAGWALGVLWLGVTAAAFRRWRAADGLPTRDVTAGLAPEAAADLAATDHRRRRFARPALAGAQLLVAAVLITGLLFGLGFLITSLSPGSSFAAADLGIVQWFTARRTPAATEVMSRLNKVGDTGWVIAVGLAACVLALARYRSWRPVVFLVTVLVGEVLLFVTVATVVTRARPLVEHLQPRLPPTASFPSGHVAGVLCLYGAIALLTWHATRSALWRSVTCGAAVALPLAVATARLYRGVHHPTDIAGSVLLAALWLTATWLALRPGAGERPTAWLRRAADEQATGRSRRTGAGDDGEPRDGEIRPDMPGVRPRRLQVAEPDATTPAS